MDKSIVQQTSEKALPKQDHSVYAVDGKVLRVDPQQSNDVAQPHTTFKSMNPQTGSWEFGVGSIEFGFETVFENDLAMQQAAREFSETVITDSQTYRPLNIEPAWETASFRWPRITKRFLNSHYSLFDQIGNALISQLDVTRRRIGICSTQRQEGKTTIATCLARWSATTGKRTLLIDADVENSRLTVNSGLSVDLGWKQVVDTDIQVSEVMVRSAETGLVIMPGCIDQRPIVFEKLLESLCSIVFQMKYEFDVVIIDAGTIDGICAHGNEGMDLVDSMLIVRDPSRTSNGQLIETKQVLYNLGMNKTSVVENFVRN